MGDDYGENFCPGVINMNMQAQDRIISATFQERIAQDQKWGSQINKTDSTWMAILGEEIGELAEAILSENQENVAEESIQSIAVLVAWAEAFDARALLPGLNNSLLTMYQAMGKICKGILEEKQSLILSGVYNLEDELTQVRRGLFPDEILGNW